MATSGTTTFTVTRDQIIEAALRSLAVLEEGATPGPNALENASFSLNLIFLKQHHFNILFSNNLL